MEYKVIFHIDENAKWPMVLGNIENLLNAAGTDHIIAEVLANGEAVLKYKDTAEDSGGSAAAMISLHEKGVTFAACQNAMRANGLTKDELLGFVTPVPAGVMELVKRQAQGYGYIKP